MAVIYTTGKDMERHPIDSDKCIQAATHIIEYLNSDKFILNERELVATLGTIVQSIGWSLEDEEGSPQDRSEAWKAYKEKGTLGYALQMMGLDMLEYWAKIDLEYKEIKEEE